MVIPCQNIDITNNIFFKRYDSLIEKVTYHVSNLGHIYQGLNMTVKNNINESDIGKYNQQ